MSATAVDIVIPVSPAVERAFAISPADAQLVVTAYVAGMALGLLPVGAMADRFGRRPVALCGIVLFSACGAAMALPLSIAALLALRFVQGLAGACGPALSRAIVRDLDLPDSGARLMALVTAALSLAPLLGPLLGGLLAGYLEWRAPFWVSAIYGLAALAAIVLWLPETGHRQQDGGIARQVGKAIGIMAGSKPTQVAMVLFALPFVGYFAILTSLSQVMHDLFAVTAEQFGLLFALAALSYLGGALLARWLLKSYPARTVLGMGMSVLALAGISALFLLAAGQPDPLALWWTASAFMFGMAVCLPITTMKALAPLAGTAGIGASVLGVGQIGIGTLGSLVSARFYAGNHASMCAVIATSALGVAYVHWRYRATIWDGEAAAHS